MRNGPIPLAVHATAEPFLALLFIAAPFVFGFSDDSAPTTLSILVGVAVLAAGLTTNWRIAIKRIIPLPVHALLDAGLGVFLVISPFVLDFSEASAPTLFFVLIGIALVLSAVGTRWTHDADLPGGGRKRRPRTASTT